MRTQRWLLVVIWLAGTLALSGLTGWWLLGRPRSSAHGHQHHHAAAEESEAAFHAWMHQNLGLSPEQEARMAPQEKAYEAERRRLRAAIKEAGRALALRVREADRFDQELRAPLERLSAAQRQLQEATLAHFFEMKAHLDDRQRELLRQWTHDSLLHEHHE